MNDKKLCPVIKDVLPLYMDNLICKETKDIVDNHLENCIECSSLYKVMREEAINNDKDIIENVEIANEVDYLKKIRKKSRKKIWLGIGLAIFILLIITYIKLFIYGSPTESYIANTSIEDGKVKIQGEFVDSISTYSHYKIIEKDGKMRLVIYATLSSFINSDSSFEIEYSLEDVGEKGLIVNNKKILKSGEEISTKAVEIYEKRNSFIGDMPKNNELANAIGISDDLGPYTSELQTEKEPYGWTLYFNTILEESNEKIFNEKMKSYAYILLATIDNVGEISWSYMVKTKDGIKQEAMTLTTMEADAILGEEVKGFGISEDRLSELLIKVGVTSNGAGKSQLKEYKYRLELTGRTSNAVKDTTYIVLTNNKDLTFEQVDRSLYSSNSKDFIEDMVIVDIK